MQQKNQMKEKKIQKNITVMFQRKQKMRKTIKVTKNVHM